MNKSDAHVYLIRHAESVANLHSHIIGGRSNESPLSETGIEQAKKLGAYLVAHELLPTQVYVSPAIRTLQTASISLASAGLNLSPRIDNNLQELSQGDWTGLERSSIYTNETLADIHVQGKDFKAPGGESMNEVGARMHNALNNAVEQHSHKYSESPVILVYTHGLAIRCFASFVHNWSHKQTFATQTPNASISYFSHSDRAWNLQYLGQQTS